MTTPEFATQRDEPNSFENALSRLIGKTWGETVDGQRIIPHKQIILTRFA